MSPRLDDIQIRDPFVLTQADSGQYLLFGSTDKNIWSGQATGFDCYRSTDLLNWEGPIEAFRPAADFWSQEQYWAPEVHEYHGRFYLFATFTAPGRLRGTQILSAEKPEGPYTPWSDGPVTPAHWQCLDGTLHVDAEGNPWMVFCHEWKQVHDGAMLAQRLSGSARTFARPRACRSSSSAPRRHRGRVRWTPPPPVTASSPSTSPMGPSCSASLAETSSCCGPVLATMAIPWASPAVNQEPCLARGPRKPNHCGALTAATE
ncbi:family 43 glycosylhydrolase [Arthrobacter sp. TS-15]|uniref:family 43 glycosylhydrolase n=1 Tax=Arthrobacter sp. TS-15 TaxID=2510797 RepID=UPI001EE9ABA6|nr:family 43 glycosylhydrolase [Arthrobacter sp. TS-15]